MCYPGMYGDYSLILLDVSWAQKASGSDNKIHCLLQIMCTTFDAKIERVFEPKYQAEM